MAGADSRDGGGRLSIRLRLGTDYDLHFGPGVSDYFPSASHLAAGIRPPFLAPPPLDSVLSSSDAEYLSDDTDLGSVESFWDKEECGQGPLPGQAEKAAASTTLSDRQEVTLAATTGSEAAAASPPLAPAQCEGLPQSAAQSGHSEATPGAAAGSGAAAVPPYRPSTSAFYVPGGAVLPFGVALSYGTPSDWGTPGRLPLVPWQWVSLCDAKWGPEWLERSSPVAQAFRCLWCEPMAREVWLMSDDKYGEHHTIQHDLLDDTWRRALAFEYCARKYYPAEKPDGITQCELGDCWLENALFEFYGGCQQQWGHVFPVAGGGITSRLQSKARGNDCLFATAVWLGLVDPSTPTSQEHHVGQRMELTFYELATRVWEPRRSDSRASRDILFLTLAVHAFRVIETNPILLTKWVRHREPMTREKKREKRQRRRARMQEAAAAAAAAASQAAAPP